MVSFLIGGTNVTNVQQQYFDNQLTYTKPFEIPYQLLKVGQKYNIQGTVCNYWGDHIWFSWFNYLFIKNFFTFSVEILGISPKIVRRNKKLKLRKVKEVHVLHRNLIYNTHGKFSEMVFLHRISFLLILKQVINSVWMLLLYIQIQNIIL